MSFRPTACYDLSTHTVNFDHSGVEVILDSSGLKVDGASYATGFDIMVVRDQFCFGEIDFDDHFIIEINLVEQDSGFDFVEPKSRIVGSDELDNPVVLKHYWDIDECPVRMKLDDTDVVAVKCPCDTQGSPCTNSCYKTSA